MNINSDESTIFIMSLGCDKNRVDTEKMLFRLRNFTIVPDMSDADIIIINTCSFILPAREESINAILEASQYKNSGSCKKLIVTGCLPERYIDELKDDLPEVDAFLGTNDYDGIVEALNGGIFVSHIPCNDIRERILTTPPHYAYLKIADGCDNFCTYCMIPSIRGKYRSVPIDDLVEEANRLVASGVKELILVAQDVTRYGYDLYGEYKLIELIKRLSMSDIIWIRLMYCYPELVTDELIDEIKNNKKVAKYIDIPLQHVDNDVLKRMNRKSTYESVKELILKLKKNNIAVRTTLMTGFPGESEAQFERLKKFVEEEKLRHVGVFAYCDEDTPSAKMSGKLDESTKEKRASLIAKAHEENVCQYNSDMIGKTVRVVYEDIDYDRALFVGRTEDCAPEVDTNVYFKSNYADVGNFYNVRIMDYDGFDLVGVCEDEPL